MRKQKRIWRWLVALWIRKVQFLRCPVITASSAQKSTCKGYPVSQNIDFLYVHDLVYLTQRCMERKQAFTELEQAARILSKYGAGVRYPMENFVDPDEEEAWEAIKLAEEVATFVKS